MAEAFGVGAGIVGVLGLTIQIAQVVFQFGSDWKDAPKDLKDFVNEVQSLKVVLSETNTNFIQDKDFNEAFRGRRSILLSRLGANAPRTDEIGISVASCEANLKEFLDDLRKRADVHKFSFKRLKEPFLAQKTRQSVASLRHHCQVFNNMVSMDTLKLGAITQGEMRAARKEQKEWHNAEKNQKILTWISNLSFEKKQKDLFSKRHPGTGQWLLDDDKFQTWRDDNQNAPSVLWCPGIPGAGKSVMTSIVVDHLQQVSTGKDVSISFIYCDYKDREAQTTISLVSNLVKQIILQQNSMPGEVSDLYGKHGNGQRSLSLEDCSRLLSSFSNHFRRSYILVDALDEHFVNNDEETTMQLALLDVLLGLQHLGTVSGGYALYFTSRENDLIQERLAGCVRLDIRAADSDIESYLRSRIGDPTKFSYTKKLRDDTDLADEIVGELVDKAQGMFLLPRLHMDRLGCQTSVRNLRKELKNLPTKLYETYDKAMNRIQGQVEEHSNLALRALSWISNALRPLYVEELRNALAVEPGDHSLDEEALVDETLIITVSAGLITLDVESDTMRLVHFTVEEYFREQKQKRFPGADSRIAETCLTYLSFDTFKKGRCSSDKEFEARLHENRLLDYAARYWIHHADRGWEDIDRNLALDFLADEDKMSYSIQVAFVPIYQYEDYSQRIVDHVSGMHLAAFNGLARIASELVESEIAVDSKDSHGQTPLSCAAEHGHEGVAKLLLKRDDVNADSRDESNRTPLSRAVMKGHEAVVKLLLERDVNADSYDDNNYSPLSYAAENGHEAIVKLLLEGDVNAEGSPKKYKQTPLLYAAEHGHEAVVRHLLERDVNADSPNDYNQTPLFRAAMKGHEAVVKLLLEREVNADSCDKSNRTPLLYAAMNGHEAVMKLLLERDVNADSHDEYNGSPLSSAAENGHEAIVKLLLERDVKADSHDVCGQTPLSYAAENGHEAIVKLLLRRDDINADSYDKDNRTPLSYAAQNGHEAVVKLLLERDDVHANSHDRTGRTPLVYAVERGSEETIKLLIDREDVTVDSQDYEGRTPLSYAAECGHEKVVKVLIDRDDVALDSQDHKGRTPLSYACGAWNERKNVVKLLIDRDDVAVDSQDHQGRTPLSYAIAVGHREVVKLLKEKLEKIKAQKQSAITT